MSKESKIKKRLEKINKQSPPPVKTDVPVKAKLTLSKPRPRRKLNLRFIILLAIWIVAFVVAMLFLSKR